ncbi:hypothetical protein RclHR1_02040039 [Rhizophagus clarus]|uniref:Uncharacterized protein n=1 Tax=Rhizophagus clarus TaxID=94130 RepID=A0A2Z6QRC8_9GLOM|nr:hypothetical protein RclHR1_02040039 [Rhizophagus clarus]
MDLYIYNLDEYSSDTRQGNEYTPIWPFRLAVAGSSDSGKTTMLINLLMRNAKAKEYETRYIFCDEIVLIGKYLDEPKWQIVKDFFDDDENVIFEAISYHQMPNVEDFIPKLLLNISAIYVAQRFYAIPKAIRENVNYISLHGGHGSLSDTKRIIRQYTNESDSLAPIINELTLSREFIVFDLRHPKTDPLLIRVRWDTSLRIIMESSNNDSRMITCLSKIDLRSSKNDSRTILESSKNDLSQFTSYGQKAIAEAKKNNLLKEFAQNFSSPKEQFAQNFPSPKERKLYLKQDALSKAKNSDIWAKYVFREAYGINDRTLGDEYKKFLSQVKNVYVIRDNFPVSVLPFDRYRELLNERLGGDKGVSHLRWVTPDAIPYPRSNDLLAKYQEEIAQLQVVAKEKRNGTHDISQNKSIDELADWLVGPVKGSKPKESEEILPTTFDEWADKQEWLRKENSERHEDGSIWWFSRRIPKLASKKVKNEHGFGYWHLAREAYKPHITNNYAKKIRDLMDDDEEYVIGVATSLDELLLIDKRGWLSWKDSDAIKFNEYQDEPYNLELEGLPYTLRFQFMACSRQKLYGPGIHEDGTVWWHSDELVRVSYKMASEVCHLLYNSTEYTLFIRLYTSESIVEEMGDKGWHFGKKKKAGSLTGEEITLGQLEGINIFLRAKTQEYVNHICYELRPVPRPQGPPGPFYDGDLNCIIAELQRLIEHGGTKRAIGLTPARESALAKFNEKVRAPGCTLDDLHILEKLEKSGGIGMKIVVKDILGNEMWNSDRYLKQRKLSILP